MSLKFIETEVLRFLTSPEAEVLVIRGDWGVGKTYFWKKYFKNNHQKSVLPSYGYISLFGINNLNDFKSAIFCELEYGGNGDPMSMLLWVQKTKKLWKEGKCKEWLHNFGRPLKKIIHFFKSVFRKLYFINTQEVIRYLSFKFIKNSTICIDDFDRIGNGLAIRDVMGLISFLKEENNCKFILILNDKELQDNSDEYKKLIDKVVDSEIFFKITPVEALEMIIAKDDTLYSELKQWVIKLEINNIRVLKKLERLARELHKQLINYDSKVLYQAMQTLSLFVSSYYSKQDEKIPKFDDLKIKYADILSIHDKENDKLKKWNVFLKEYGFSYTDSFDLIIANGVEQGYFNNVLLDQEAKELNRKIKINQSKENVWKAWEPFFSSFQDNVNEVVCSLKKGFYNNYLFVDPINLSNATYVLRNIGQEDLADEMISFYIENRRMEKGLFSIKESSFFSYIKDSVVIDRFQEIADEQQDEKKPLRDIVKSIAESNSWSTQDIDDLASTSSDDYYNFFENITDEDLQRMVNGLLKFGNTSNESESHKTIYNSVLEALKKLGKLSSLNAIRVANYGIEID